jgi:hypothetical protein
MPPDWVNNRGDDAYSGGGGDSNEAGGGANNPASRGRHRGQHFDYPPSHQQLASLISTCLPPEVGRLTVNIELLTMAIQSFRKASRPRVTVADFDQSITSTDET